MESIDQSSDEDDKLNPNFWVKSDNFNQLPEAVRQAIENGMLRAKHSAFYYRLKDLNDKIKIYNAVFKNKVPKHYLWY